MINPLMSDRKPVVTFSGIRVDETNPNQRKQESPNHNSTSLNRKDARDDNEEEGLEEKGIQVMPSENKHSFEREKVTVNPNLSKIEDAAHVSIQLQEKRNIDPSSSITPSIQSNTSIQRMTSIVPVPNLPNQTNRASPSSSSVVPSPTRKRERRKILLSTKTLMSMKRKKPFHIIGPPTQSYFLFSSDILMQSSFQQRSQVVYILRCLADLLGWRLKELNKFCIPLLKHLNETMENNSGDSSVYEECDNKQEYIRLTKEKNTSNPKRYMTLSIKTLNGWVTELQRRQKIASATSPDLAKLFQSGNSNETTMNYAFQRPTVDEYMKIYRSVVRWLLSERWIKIESQFNVTKDTSKVFDYQNRIRLLRTRFHKTLCKEIEKEKQMVATKHDEDLQSSQNQTNQGPPIIGENTKTAISMSTANSAMSTVVSTANSVMNTVMSTTSNTVSTTSNTVSTTSNTMSTTSNTVSAASSVMSAATDNTNVPLNNHSERLTFCAACLLSPKDKPYGSMELLEQRRYRIRENESSMKTCDSSSSTSANNKRSGEYLLECSVCDLHFHPSCLTPPPLPEILVKCRKKETGFTTGKNIRMKNYFFFCPACKLLTSKNLGVNYRGKLKARTIPNHINTTQTANVPTGAVTTETVTTGTVTTGTATNVETYIDGKSVGNESKGEISNRKKDAMDWNPYYEELDSGSIVDNHNDGEYREDEESADIYPTTKRRKVRQMKSPSRSKKKLKEMDQPIEGNGMTSLIVFPEIKGGDWTYPMLQSFDEQESFHDLKSLPRIDRKCVEKHSVFKKNRQPRF
eukprot:g685.t1